jgi:hypothetical protein
VVVLHLVHLVMWWYAVVMVHLLVMCQCLLGPVVS